MINGPFELPLPKGLFLSPRRHTPTAWLDGLRGYAALLVFFCHYFFAYFHTTKFVYGTVPKPGAVVPHGNFIPYGSPVWNGTAIDEPMPYMNRGIFQLPILRLLVFGDPMVSIFFIVSGYALSMKPLSLIRRGPSAQSDLLSSLASSIFRRPVRLLLPCLVSTFLVAIAVRLGLFYYSSLLAGDEHGGAPNFHRYFRGWAHEATPDVFPDFYEQFWDWCYSMGAFMDFFNHHHWVMTKYDIHLWTIPVEFRCSLLLYLTLAATAQLTSQARLAILGILVTGACSWGDMWEMGLFWSGMALCEFDMIRDEEAANSDDLEQSNVPQWPVEQWLFTLIAALYLLSYPIIFAEYTPFYSWMSWLQVQGLRESDQFRIWHCTGAVLLVMAVSNSKPLKDFFSNRFARYLGRISYALYMVHGPINRALGYSLVFQLWIIFGNRNQMQYNTAVFIGFVVVFAAVMYSADLFCWTIDEPIVRFAKWLEDSLRDQDHIPRIVVPEPQIDSLEMDALRRGTSLPPGYLERLEEQPVGVASLQRTINDDLKRH